MHDHVRIFTLSGHCSPVQALTTSIILLHLPLGQHVMRILNTSSFSVLPLPHAPNTDLEDQVLSLAARLILSSICGLPLIHTNTVLK
jgi:hypothetical protein